MSGMEGNAPYANTEDALEQDAVGTGSYLDPQTRALTVAQIEATLTLAYEQRTANLIEGFAVPRTSRKR